MKTKVVFSVSFVALIGALAACSSGGGGTGGGAGDGGTSSTGGGSSGGGSSGGKAGGGSSPSPSASSTSSSSSSASCCVQLKFYACPSDGDATKCFNSGNPGACTADSSQDKKCCKESGFSCSKASECCSGSCITDPDDADNTICK